MRCDDTKGFDVVGLDSGDDVLLRGVFAATWQGMKVIWVSRLSGASRETRPMNTACQLLRLNRSISPIHEYSPLRYPLLIKIKLKALSPKE